jgi:hypothetical protein
MVRTQQLHDASGIYLQTDRGDAMYATGTTVPTDGNSGYEVGCVFVDTDASDGSNAYINEGTRASCDFNLLVTAESAQTISAGHTFSGSNTFSGAVTFTGTRVAPVLVLSTSAVTLSPTTHSGKVLLFTSGAGSTHVTVTLPLSTSNGATSGADYIIVNGITGLSSDGITIAGSSDDQLGYGTSNIVSTTAAEVSASIRFVKVNDNYVILSKQPGNVEKQTSLVWIYT